MSGHGRAGGMTPAEFIAKWRPVRLPERAASQEHFLDLCRMLGQPTPAQLDATGAEYTFEKGVSVTGPASRGAKGTSGFADVWWRGKFGWEYKRRDKHRDLAEAYRQLCQYREALENPPLLIVSDIARIEIHTSFTSAPVVVHTIPLERIDHPTNLAVLRRVFTDPGSFRPDVTTETVTKEVAEQFALLSQSLQGRGHDPHTAAHFLMKCMFCLFAEDVGLLPSNLFTRLLEQWKDEPKQLPALLTELFGRMRTGGAFGTERIAHFNGGLFDGAPALALGGPEVGEMLLAARQDWSSVEPAIFGTLFERSLDPSKRAQIGAHYTSRDDIMLVVEPVIIDPLRREWDVIRAKCDAWAEKRAIAAARREKKIHKKGERTPTWYNRRIESALVGFLERLASIRVLDPACGSGNFLYVAIQRLLCLEKDVISYGAHQNIGLLPTVRPTQLYGIDINPYAAELAQVVIWIGYLQWMRDNGFIPPRDPILEPLQTIECRDGILDLSDPDHPRPADWPAADFIVGNPPFLGDKLLRGGLGDQYVDTLFRVYENSLPHGSDLCCYWFEVGRRRLRGGGFPRVGLLATQGIRGGANRHVLARIADAGGIFMAWSDRKWILEGANVHVSMVGFDDGTERLKHLDGMPVGAVYADLSSGCDLTAAKGLPGNVSTSFLGSCKGGSFDVPHDEAAQLLRAGGNPHGRANTDVVRPVVNSSDLLGRNVPRWIIDNGNLTLEEASLYQAPHAIVEARVRPNRAQNRNRWLRENWWRPQRMRPEMRKAIAGLPRFAVTPTTAKHRVFRWVAHPTLPDHQLIVFARSDDYFFGVLHSSIHELWALRMGTQLEDRPRYTPTTCFQTFPLPWPPGSEPTALGDESAIPNTTLRSRASLRSTSPQSAIWRRISAAAKALDEQRERWLNPPEWIAPIARNVDAMDDFADVPAEVRPLIRQSAIQAMAATDDLLKHRTLTKLYNERPTWLKLAHRELDAAVLAAFAATDPAGEWREDWAEVWFDTGAGQPLPAGHALAERRAGTDQKVLANLLRLNLSRAGAAK